MAFDCLLAKRGKPLLHAPFVERRAALEALFANDNGEARGLALTPFTRSLEAARRWLRGQERSLDGVVAKRLDLPYLPGVRATLKVKSLRTATAWSAAFAMTRAGGWSAKRAFASCRFHCLHPRCRQAQPDQASREADCTAGVQRRATGCAQSLEPRALERLGAVAAKPGGRSALRSRQRRRFRHGTKFMRWRPDKSPRQCTLEQLWQATPRGSAHLARHVVSST